MAELRLVSKSEAAKLLGIGKQKLNDLLETGKIRFLYFDQRIRIPIREIDRFIDENLTNLKKNKENTKIILGTSPNKIIQDFDSTQYLNNLLQGE